MNEEPKGIWRKSWKGSSWLGAWLILMAASFLIVFLITRAVSGKTSVIGSIPISLILGAILSTLFVGLWAFVLWLCCWKNFRRFLLACACLAALIVFAYGEEDWRGMHRWNKFKSEWAAKGESFDWKASIPATVPDDQNFAMAPIWVESIRAVLGPQNSRQWFGNNNAEDGRTNFVNRLDLEVTEDYNDGPTNGDWRKAAVTDLKSWQNYYRTLAVKTNLFPISAEPQTPAQDVLLALSKYNPTVEELRRASKLLYAQFPVDYNRQDTWSILLPHLAMLKRCSIFLELRAIAELQNGQTGQALQDIQLSFRLMDSARVEPFLISHLVRIAMLQMTMQPIYEGLARHQWSGPQLAALDTELAGLDFLSDYQVSIHGEIRGDAKMVTYFQHNPQALLEIAGDGDQNSSMVPRLVCHLLPSGWFYQNEWRICNFVETWDVPLMDESNRVVLPGAVRKAQAAKRQETRHTAPENFLEQMLLPDFGPAVQRFTYAQESTDLARVAIALERYRQGTGVYPGSLDLLAPNLIEEVPNDIIGGQPLHYKRTSDGQFILYSVGWNAHDDGGTVSATRKGMVDNTLGDWVWRYPAAN